jgi:hypothetical protein
LNVTKQHRPNLKTLDTLIMCEGLNDKWKARLKNRHKYLETAI